MTDEDLTEAKKRLRILADEDNGWWTAYCDQPLGGNAAFPRARMRADIRLVLAALEAEAGSRG